MSKKIPKLEITRNLSPRQLFPSARAGRYAESSSMNPMFALFALSWDFACSSKQSKYLVDE
jgi:hypothetical protein